MTFPAEWEKHKAIWTCWPAAAHEWREHLKPARAEIAAMIKALAEGGKVNLLVATAEAEQTARAMVGGAAEIIAVPYGDIWLRDTGPIFVREAAGKVALRFKNNGWGGKYIMPGDDTVGDRVAELSGAPARRHDFILEGGAIETDGAGRLLTTRQCLLNPNRNQWTESTATAILKQTFAATHIHWLTEGMLNDHTDGHIDNLARFYGAGKVVCQSPADDKDPNAACFAAIAADLRAQGLEVTQIPSPGLFMGDGEAPIPASHMNFIIGNSAVVVPTYNTPSAARAVAMLAELFPKHRVIGAPSLSTLTNGGGSFHCITQQEPI